MLTLYRIYHLQPCGYAYRYQPALPETSLMDTSEAYKNEELKVKIRKALVEKDEQTDKISNLALKKGFYVSIIEN